MPWLVDPADRTLEAFELHEVQWLLVASGKDDDPVSIRPSMRSPSASAISGPERQPIRCDGCYRTHDPSDPSPCSAGPGSESHPDLPGPAGRGTRSLAQFRAREESWIVPIRQRSVRPSATPGLHSVAPLTTTRTPGNTESRNAPIAGSQAGLPMRDQQVVTQLNEVRGLECVNDFVKTACEQLFQVRISNVSGSNRSSLQGSRFRWNVSTKSSSFVTTTRCSRTERSLISASDVRFPCGKSRVCTAS